MPKDQAKCFDQVILTYAAKGMIGELKQLQAELEGAESEDAAAEDGGAASSSASSTYAAYVAAYEAVDAAQAAMDEAYAAYVAEAEAEAEADAAEEGQQWAQLTDTLTATTLLGGSIKIDPPGVRVVVDSPEEPSGVTLTKEEALALARFVLNEGLWRDRPEGEGYWSDLWDKLSDADPIG